jgi:hypothetical protein
MGAAVIVSIPEFLRTGLFGDLRCGLAKDEVRDLLGAPDDVSVRRNPELWKYGPLELAFFRPEGRDESSLSSLSLQFWDPGAAWPDSLEPTGWLPSGQTTFAEFRAFLDASAIPVYGGAMSGPQQHLVVGSGVRVSFDEGSLHSVNYTPRREPDIKQITVAIPREHWKAIQQEAAASGVSVSRLCARWIAERAASLQPT